jgi:hypothetical protein
MAKRTVRKDAFVHSADIDPTLRIDGGKLASLANVCISRAVDALNRACPRYNELRRFQMAEVLTSMKSTQSTIRKLVGEGFEGAEAVNALVLARLQLEGLYVFCLMLESPDWVDCYLRDGWKKMYVHFLLQREETKNLSRFDDFSQTEAPTNLENLRALLRITSAQQQTIDRDELGVPLPAGVAEEKIDRFPTPGALINAISEPGRKSMLERLYYEYIYLSSFSHGLPQSNLFKRMFGEHTIHSKLFSDSKRKEKFQENVVEEPFLISFVSMIQCAAELTTLYPTDTDLLAAVTGAWTATKSGGLLINVIWGIRTKKLLRALG